MTGDSPERNHSQSFESVKRHWAFKGLRVLALILPGIIASIGAYATATDDAEDRAAVVEKKADYEEDAGRAGYKVTKAWVAELERRVAQLDAEVVTLKRAARISSKRAAVRVTVVNHPSAPTPPPPLPATLDKALEQVKRPPVPAAPAEAPKP